MKRTALVIALIFSLAFGGVAAAWAAQGGGGSSSYAPAPSDLYNSMTVSSNYQWSFAYDATGANQLGNDITLANGGGRLNDVVVSMANFNPGSQSKPLPITLNIYNPNSSLGEPGNGVPPGSLIASDTVTITPPGTSTGYTPGTGAPSYGVDNFDVTFNFASQHVTLPDDVVYGIAYNNTAVDQGLNVNLSYESSSVPSVGADTFPSFLFVSIANPAYNDVGPGEVTCQTVNTTFEQYITQAATYGGQNCGAAAFDDVPGPNDGNAGPGLLVPAVEFTAASGYGAPSNGEVGNQYGGQNQGQY